MKSTGADRGIALFDTELGRCGVAWGERGLRGVALPGGRDDRIRARLRRASPGAADAVAPVAVLEVIDGIVDLLAGAPADLSAVEVDSAGIPQFDRRVAAVARTVGPGETITYGEIAARLGIRDAREVGAALGRNRLPIVDPVSPRRCRKRRPRRLLGAGRPADEAADARDRAPPRRRAADAVRRLSASASAASASATSSATRSAAVERRIIGAPWPASRMTMSSSARSRPAVRSSASSIACVG